MLLDDLHWADPATLAALAYLHRRSAVLPGAVIATVEAEKALTSHQLHRLPASARIVLPPLSPEELAEAGLEHLHPPTQGNYLPFQRVHPIGWNWPEASGHLSNQYLEAGLGQSRS